MVSKAVYPTRENRDDTRAKAMFLQTPIQLRVAMIASRAPSLGVREEWGTAEEHLCSVLLKHKKHMQMQARTMMAHMAASFNELAYNDCSQHCCTCKCKQGRWWQTCCMPCWCVRLMWSKTMNCLHIAFIIKCNVCVDQTKLQMKQAWTCMHHPTHQPDLGLRALSIIINPANMAYKPKSPELFFSQRVSNSKCG